MNTNSRFKAWMVLGLSFVALLSAAGCGGDESTTSPEALSNTPAASRDESAGSVDRFGDDAPLEMSSSAQTASDVAADSVVTASGQPAAGEAASAEGLDRKVLFDSPKDGYRSAAPSGAPVPASDPAAAGLSLDSSLSKEMPLAQRGLTESLSGGFGAAGRTETNKPTEEEIISGQQQSGQQRSGQQRSGQQPGRQSPERRMRTETILGRFPDPDAKSGGRIGEPGPGEELWVIAKADINTTALPDTETPGCGALMATLPNETRQVPVPLRHTNVVGNIDGYIATVDVTQQFHNPYNSKIEAVYLFPLPQNAAVNEFVMTVGDRKIRGIIREREKAEQIYAQARAQGHVASLLTQERPNIFTQKVANIEPGKQIDINIRYFNTLRYDDGDYEFVFPMVVGPRFNPAATNDGIGAVSRGNHGASGQKTEVQYLAPGERSGHDVAVTVNINTGVEIENVRCVNHAIEEQSTSPCERRIRLSAKDSLPNKDFILRYRVAGDQIKTAMLTHKDEHGQYFTMMIYPPAELSSVQRSAMEMVYVLDCSGSMNGKPIEQSKAAIEYSLQQLTPRDTFQIIQFSNNSSKLGKEPLRATPENVHRGLQYLQTLSGSGGTQMIEGIKAALDFPHDEGRFRLVSFMTDGFIGNEQQILQTLSAKLGASRIFSFGVGSSPNRYLMDRMALLGQGAVTYLSLNDNAVDIMDRFQQRISHPAMTDLTIDFGDMDVIEVFPKRIPDLIVGRPIVVTGRFNGEPSTVTVGGRIDLAPQTFSVDLAGEDRSDEHPGIAAVWARMKIADLMMAASQRPHEAVEFRQEVIQTALNYNLMSSFTAFVAVDSLTVTEGDFGTTVAVPVNVPDGVKYETAVTN
ncbi:MAG: VIT and VWA domain-containing protein [Planctomycetaceae bacterium]